MEAKWTPEKNSPKLTNVHAEYFQKKNLIFEIKTLLYSLVYSFAGGQKFAIKKYLVFKHSLFISTKLKFYKIMF